MNNTQLISARRGHNPYRAQIKLEIARSGAVETITPYRIDAPESRGTPVVVGPETPAPNIQTLLARSCAEIA